MKRVVCVNALRLSEYATMSLPDGDSAVDRVQQFVSSLPEVGRSFVICEEKAQVPFPYERIDLRDGSSAALIEALMRAGEGSDQIVYLYGDCPFLEPEITGRMLENHGRYFAEYTFSDGYPFGITPEILSTSVLPMLQRLAGSEPISRDTLFSTIQKDINSFDIETEISPVDVRMLRLSLMCDNRVNYLLCSNFDEAKAFDEKSILSTAQKRQEILRTVPAFANIQIIDGCPQACSYCPFPGFGGDILNNRHEMSFENFDRIVAGLEQFSPEATISLSLWGEPSLHSRIEEMIRRVESSRALRLNIETSGIGWKPEVLDGLAASGLERTEWIVSLDALDPALYATLRGSGQEEALRTVDRLLSTFGGHVHVQAVRMNENEAHLEEFYRSWKSKTDNVIIQKYDDFCGYLPARKVTDLSPLVRQACWHLKRDMNVLLDGSVVMCREDLNRDHLLGNLLDEEFAEVWQRGEEVYAAHVRTEYPEICKGCDEYYTFNF